MKAVITIIALLIALSASAQGKPTADECKKDPKRAGCHK